MYLVQIPFAPAEKALYDINEESMSLASLMKHYPELARCVACNTCTKACPQELEVMDYVQDALKGDFKAVTRGSFDCVQCGLCAIRCPAEIVQYHMAQLARRLFGKYGIPEEEHVTKRVEEIESGAFEEEFKRITALSQDELEKVYVEQQKTRQVY
jgi:CO dehydrogenase/acetyl-CoA synthase alpha subunit